MAAYATAAGDPVARGTVTMLRTGCGTADLRLGLPADDRPAFAPGDRVPVVITDPDDDRAYTFAMACLRLGIEDGMWRAALRAGAARLDREVAPRFYRDAPGVIILSDCLREVGESLSETAAISTALPVYVRRRGPAFADVLALVSRYPGATWRVLPDGDVWAGIETWPEAGDQAVVIEASPGWDRLLCHPVPAVECGTVLHDAFSGAILGRVERLIHHVGSELRTEIFVVPHTETLGQTAREPTVIVPREELYVTRASQNGQGSPWVAKAGDTMLGFLTLHDDPTLPLHAATKRYADVIHVEHDVDGGTY